ncbi:hypothetical protein Golob_003027, partial [Gossypium lobatum]|nr:hypothetical protein [Gossypium lobatum]
SSNGFEHQSKSQQAFSQSAFGASFCKKLEENTDSRSLNTFEKSLSVLNRCDYQKPRCNGEFSQSERVKVRRSPRRMNSQHQMKHSFGDQKGRTATLSSLFNTDDNLTSIAKSSLGSEFKVNVIMCYCGGADNINVLSSVVCVPFCHAVMKIPAATGQTVVIVDEEEPQLVKTTELEVELPNWDDPESVEICFGDIDSLAPETFLTSQIMNFYIRYMREEWTYLNQEVAPSDLPIADKIWENLPRRIDEKTIAVPQQKNDYDCGLFVLFFMERFIEEAPERLKQKDLAMFGKQWFRPEEASSLRTRIRNLLIEQFQTTTEEQFQTTIEDTGGSQSSPSS